MNIILKRTSFESWVYIAYDPGPRETLKPLAEAFGRAVLSPNSSEWESPAPWRDYLLQWGVQGLICGTSESRHGFAAEVAARLAARELHIPVVVIEDFPGSYRAHEEVPTDLLVVESEFSEHLYRSRYKCSPQMVCVAPPRYDNLRRCSVSFPVPVSKPCRVLWVGQPETESGLATLSSIAEFLQCHDVTLLFRAHPRDSGYLSGRYAQFFNFSELRWLDVTNCPLDSLVTQGIQLSLTHFSSLAIELGFHGVPAVNILLPEAGGADLQRLKGCRLTAACEYGAAFCIRNAEEIGVLETALLSVSSRLEVHRRFDQLYDTHNLKTPLLVQMLKVIMLQL